MHHLRLLDIRLNSQYDKSIIYAILDLNRHMELLCADTKVNMVEFEFNHPETVKTYLDRNYFSFKYKNLTIECNLYNELRMRNHFRDDNLIYIGSPFSTDDEDQFQYLYDEYYGDDNGGDEDFGGDDFEDPYENEMFVEYR